MVCTKWSGTSAFNTDDNNKKWAANWDVTMISVESCDTDTEIETFPLQEIKYINKYILYFVFLSKQMHHWWERENKN